MIGGEDHRACRHYSPDDLPPLGGIVRWNRWVRDRALRLAQNREAQNSIARGAAMHARARWDVDVSMAPDVTPQAFMLPRK